MPVSRPQILLVLLAALLLAATLSCRPSLPPPVPLPPGSPTSATLTQTPPAPSPAPTDVFAIYGLSPATPDELVIRDAVSIPRNLPLADRIQELADDTSELRFQNAPIQLLRIEETDDGRKIAVLDLQPLPDGRDLWRTIFFQGSTGGQDTKRTLIETFLQRNYPGEWIDGVQFLHLGRFPHKDALDHIDLSEIYYRGKQ